MAGVARGKKIEISNFENFFLSTLEEKIIFLAFVNYDRTPN